MKNNIIYKLYKRNLIYQISNENKLINYLNNNSINLYCGYDPNSDSLHIGHLLSLICLKRFYLNNNKNKIFILIGGSTSIIGDPSFRNKKRCINFTEKILFFSKKISDQIKNILDINNNNLFILNNNEWFKNLNIIDFLKKIGNYFLINKLIDKKIIKEYLNLNNLSFSEFSYSILQSYDFYHMFKNYKVKLQIGGSDQLTNINSGINLIKKKTNIDTYGLTFPILTKKNGEKFSKSNNDNIWLDINKTTPYKFYQFIINISDSYIYKLLNMLSFKEIEYIYFLKNQNNTNCNLISKKILANYLVKLIHGNNELNIVLKITNNLFKENIFNLNEYDLYQISTSIDKIYSKLGISLQESLIKLNISKSKIQSKNIISSNSIFINGKVNSDIKYIFKKEDILYNKYTLICKGKKKYYLIIWDN
ncbi:tyrosine--tRNA ligase [endosymbiont of Sipalinus gigas]|uniref:tyrosine--tRNA ligase n=1 Tax=endosymbiont of Sipalinus gigas TaxID=1972134 RepID=UPI000DC72DC7|nr:tyrosine--tRNA ligase [endosymbiont of Sipalinus gigas]BBA85285.1 tyrosine--tRNA ligase [endosymbiont of Sipalinus gigas]